VATSPQKLMGKPNPATEFRRNSSCPKPVSAVNWFTSHERYSSDFLLPPTPLLLGVARSRGRSIVAGSRQLSTS
jgi:hypothetical protein